MPPISPAPPGVLLPSPAVPALCSAVLVAGVFGLLPQLVATAIAVAISTGAYGGALVLHAWHTLRLSHPFIPYRPAGLLGIAQLATGGTVVVTLHSGDFHETVSGTGLALCVALYLVALANTPGAGGTRGWLVRTLDGLGFGAGALFALWVGPLSTGPFSTDPQVLSVVLLATCTVPIILLGTVAAFRRRPTAGYCHLGVFITVLGLAAFALSAQGVLNEVPLAGALMIFGPVLVWHGVRGIAAQPTTPRVRRPAPAALRALLPVAPLVLVVGGAWYRLRYTGQLDEVALILGLVLLVLLAFRESLARLRIHDQEAELHWLRGRMDSLCRIRPLETVGLPGPHRTIIRGGRSTQAGALPSGRPWTTTAASRPAATHGPVGSPGHRPGAASGSAGARVAATADRISAGASPLGPVTRRRLMAELKHRLARFDPTAALLVIGVQSIPGALVASARTLTDVQVVAGLAGLAAPLGDGRYLILVDGGLVRVGAVASRLLDALRQGYGGAETRTVSIGVAELIEAATAAGVLDRARLAQERAARQGTGIEWFDEQLGAAEERHAALLRELPHALARDEFTLLFRPVVDLATGRPVGAQAVVRWSSPTLGVVSPSEYLPVANETGEIISLGDWVLQSACRQLSHWQADGRDLWLLLRLVRPYLYDPNLTETVGSALARHHLPAGQLMLETSEEAVADAPATAIEQLTALRALGTRTCLAGAGTGLVPIAQLRRLPVDIFKLTAPPSSTPLLTKADSATALALVAHVTRRYGVELVADGVATAEQLDRVRASGCRLASGPVFGAPLALERFEAMLRDFRTPVADAESD